MRGVHRDVHQGAPPIERGDGEQRDECDRDVIKRLQAIIRSDPGIDTIVSPPGR